MLSRRARGAALSGALALLLLILPAQAMAIEPSSQITTPAGTTYLFDESGSKLKVSGTAEGVTEVSIRCYTGPTSYGGELAGKVKVEAGAFSAEVSTEVVFTMPCQLRAVPQGTSPAAQGPGSKTAFEGPLLVASTFVSEAFNYSATSSTLAGAYYFESAGHYGLESSLYSVAGHIDQFFFYGEADLTAKPPIGTRSSVQVDGANGYVPYAAIKEIEQKLEGEAGKKVELPGKPALTVTKEFNEATHQITIHEEDPVVKCSPGTEYPPEFKTGGCTSFVSTGVTLVRAWQTSNEDHVAWLTDTWRSTDGAAHTVNVRYYTELTGSAEGDVFRFPGEGGFAATNKAGETKTLPAGPGMILIKSAPGLSEGGNGENPQGVIAYDAAPSEPIAVTKASSKTKVNVFETPYQRTVPAGGTATLRMAFTQAFALPEAQALAEAAVASYYPAVSISSPASGSTITSATPAVTVSGTASDAVALSSLTVNGKAVAVAAGGTWSTSVPLTAGTNTITATATNQSGLSKSASVTVTYAPAAPRPAPATASQVGGVRGANGQATFTIACHGATGTSCKVHAEMSTVEKLRRGRVIGLIAKVRSKTVTVASLTLVIPAGQTVKVTLKPNATGRSLLARFHRLPVHLTAILEGQSGRTTVIAQNLTIKPKPKPHHRRRH